VAPKTTAVVQLPVRSVFRCRRTVRGRGQSQQESHILAVRFELKASDTVLDQREVSLQLAIPGRKDKLETLPGPWPFAPRRESDNHRVSRKAEQFQPSYLVEVGFGQNRANSRNTLKNMKNMTINIANAVPEQPSHWETHITRSFNFYPSHL
jgi:hypothetical protein